MANCNYVGVVKIQGEYKDGSWMIVSENLPGFFLAGGDLRKLRSDIPAAICLLYKLNYGMDVKVCLAGEPGERPLKPAVREFMREKWAAVPIAA